MLGTDRDKVSEIRLKKQIG